MQPSYAIMQHSITTVSKPEYCLLPGFILEPIVRVKN